ncbi:MAG: S8 family serine peptidase [Planctomycetota bacterium]
MVQGRLNHPDKIAALRALGVELLGVQTWQCHVAAIPLARLDRIAALPFVRWVGQARPDQKLSPELARLLATTRPGETLRIHVDVFESDLGPASVTRPIPGGQPVPQGETAQARTVIPNGRFQEQLEALGFVLRHYTDVGNVHIFEGEATAAAVLKIRDLDFVACVETWPDYAGAHDQSMGMVSLDRVRASYPSTTSPITIGLIDSGIRATPYRHVDFASKYMVAWTSNSTWDPYQDGHGHGTHISGTMLGEGVAQPRYRGGSPGLGRLATSRYFIGRFLNDSNNGTGSVSTLYAALSADYTDGANNVSKKPRVINNSWGSSPSTTLWSGTESGARTIDAYVYTYDQLHVFCSGNSGVGTWSPGTAKNVLTVGSVDDHWSGTVPGDRSSFSMANTSDNRMKPEVMAPGNIGTSTANTSTTGYRNMSGTSMATPHATTAMAGLIDHYPSYFDYDPAGLKANIIAASEWQGSPGTSSGYFGGVGHGLINAYKMHYGSTSSTWFKGGKGTLTSSGQYVYWDVTVPSNCVHIKVVLTWIEPAAASSATQARVDDVRLYLDVAPFTAGGNTGEYSTSSSYHTVISLSRADIATAAAGKSVRIKAYGQSIASGSAAKVGMTALYYLRDPDLTTKTFATTVSPSICKPSATVTFTPSFTAGSTSDVFENARIYPSIPSGFSLIDMTRTTADAVTQSYTDSSHTSNPYPSVSLGTSGGMTVGQGTSRALVYRLTAPTTSGSYSLTAYGYADPGGSTALSSSKTVCVDGLAPNTVSGLTSTTHTVSAWSSNTAFSAKWSQATDVGCADVGGYAYAMTTSSGSVPATQNITPKTTLTKAVTLSPSTSGWYFHIRSVDNANNFSSATSRVGPFYIDTSNPSITSVQVNSNATYTNSLTVNVKASASDTYSGAYQMRYSGDNATWSGWYSYQTTDRSLNMASLGWTTSNGTKAVYVQVRDQALNVSPTVADTIVLDTIAPVISSASINGGATVTNSLSATLATSVSGSPTEMRYSNNNSTWSGWVTYTSSLSVSLSAYGSNTNEGTKAVYVRCRDAAGNVSSTASDTILYYLTPAITGLSTSSITVVHDAAITVTGTGLGSATGFYWAAR